jgi:hypothetical protein
MLQILWQKIESIYQIRTIEASQTVVLGFSHDSEVTDTAVRREIHDARIEDRLDGALKGEAAGKSDGRITEQGRAIGDRFVRAERCASSVTRDHLDLEKCVAGGKFWKRVGSGTVVICAPTGVEKEKEHVIE